MLTLTGWERRIQAHLDDTHEYRSRGQVQRLAIKIAKRAARMQEVDPDDLIRSVLTYKDPTGDEACKRVMAVAS